MNIIKYNSSKDSTNTRTGANTTVINGGTPSGGNSESSGKLSETHLIFGNPFDGTQDVSGDITNVQNITAVGGDVVVKSQIDSDGEYGGNIEADKNIKAGGNVTATKFIGNVEASDVTTDTLQANEGTVTSISGNSLNYNNADIRQAIIDTLQSTDITTENLTVTKQAHFFELIIDKIKAAGGAVILSPADGFKVDKVSAISSGYRVYWKATDGEKSISNMWKVNDQAICQTFNAATGTSYNVSNKYYWSLVTAVGTESIDGTDYHYLDLSGTTVDGTLNPEVGDEIAMLGYRGTDDSNRQSAIYIAAYNSIDSELKAPLFAHYRGINDFNLKAHKYTWFAANGNTIKGNLQIESGQTVEDYVAQHSAEGATQYLHTAYANSSDGSKDFTKVNITGDYLYIGLKSDFTESDSALIYRDYTWSRLKGDDGESITITKWEVLYSQTSSNNQPEESSFSTTKPTLQAGYYLWTLTRVTYSDGTVTKTYSVTLNGTNGTNGVGIKTVTEYYLVSSKNSDITNETSGFSTSIPTMTSTEKYLWNYELVTKTDNSTYKTPAVIIGVYGDTGTAVTVKSTSVTYKVSDSGTTVPSGTWQTTVPSVAAGKFLWTKTVVTYSDNTSTTSYSVSYMGTNGTTIISTSVTYAVTSLSSQPADSEFTSISVPTVGLGQYLWSKTIITYSDNTNAKTYAVSRIGSDGKQGDKGSNAYLHIAYANSADGNTNFSTTYFSGAAYIGTYSDNTENDSTDYTKYTWAKIKGDNGKGISSIVNYYLATPASSGVTTSTSGWTTTVQSITTTNKYLWNYEVITYTDNSTTTTTPHIIGVYGNSGTDAEYYKLLPVIEKAEVNSSGTLAVNLQYQIVYVKGNTSSTITASSSGYNIKVLPNNSSTYYTLSYSSSPSYSNTSFQTNYHTASSKPTYFTVYLCDSSGVIKDRRIVTVVFNAAATLTITDSIQSTVSGHTSSINTLNNDITNNTNSISALTQKADRIQSTVNSHSSSINTINGNITDLVDSVSNIEQTADTIQSTVSSLKVSSGTNLFGFNKGIVWNRMGEAIPFIQGYGIECRYTSDQKTVRLTNLGFNGIGGDFVATFYIKAVTNNTRVHIDICDVSPTAGVYITATTSWKKMTLYFKDVNSYVDVSSGYNGFMDFDNLDNTGTIYIRQLQIERGTVPSEFGICLEDLQNYGNDSINNWSFNNIDIIENGFNTNGINYNVYQNNLNPSSNDYLDYITLNSITLKDKTTYTLSFWAKTDSDGTEISSYLYPDIINSSLYPYYFSSNSNQTESNNSDGFTKTKLTTSWRKYYIHWYIDTSTIDTTDWTQEQINNILVKNIIPLRLYDTTAKVSIANINFEEGYICEGNDKVSSIIRQTANDILLQVQDINIKIDNKQIELNGDTKVNGSLTLTDADQGFVLNGGSGKTVISPQSIGSFAGFQNIANSVSKLYASTTNLGSNSLTGTVDFTFTKTFSIGTVPSGKTVTLSNGSVSFMKVNSGTVISPSTVSVKYKLYQGSTLKTTYSSSATSMATMGTTTISSTDEVKISIEVTMTCSNSYWNTDSNKPVEMPFANCNMSVQASVPNDAFTLIGYDGIGLNFGGNGIIYFGQNMCQLQYGSNAIRVDANGIYKYCGSTSYSKKSHIIGGTTYTDTATSYYQQEYAPLNGYKIRRVTTSGNVYADLLDEYILCRHSSGTVNIMLGIPSYFTGKCIKIKSVGQDVNVYAGTSTSNTTYKIVRSDGSQVNSREGDDNVCRSYWSDGAYWYEEFMGW